MEGHLTQQPVEEATFSYPVIHTAIQRCQQPPANATTIQAQHHVRAFSNSNDLQPKSRLPSRTVLNSACGSSCASSPHPPRTVPPHHRIPQASTEATAVHRHADELSRGEAEPRAELSRLSTSEVDRMGSIRGIDAWTHQSLHPLIHCVSVAYFVVTRGQAGRKRIIVVILVMMLLLKGWGMNALLGYSPFLPAYFSSSSSSSSSTVSWAPSRERSELGDPVFQAQVQIGLLREEVSELAAWGYYPAIGSAVLVDEREGKQEREDGQASCIAQAPNDGLDRVEYEYEKESAGAFKALNALAPRVPARQMLDDIEGLIQELHELNDHRKDLPQIELRLEAFAVTLSALSNHHQDAHTLSHFFRVRDELHSYVEDSINPATSALVISASTILDRIPQLKVRLDSIERDVNISLASSPIIRRGKFNRRFMEAACSAFLPTRNVDSHGRHRQDISSDSVADPGDCLTGLVGNSQSLLHQVHKDILTPYHVYLMNTNFVIERAVKRLNQLTSTSLQHHCRLKKTFIEVNGQNQVPNEDNAVVEARTKAMEQCQIARLGDELQPPIEDVWGRIYNLQATSDDYNDFDRQLRFYWPGDWWMAWGNGRVGGDPRTSSLGAK